MILLAQAAQSQSTPGGSPLAALLPFALVGVALYFLMIRPQRRRMAEQRELIESTEVGDEVLTIGGIFGTVRYVDEDSDEITLEVSPGTTIRIVKSAIARKVSVGEDEEREERWLDDEVEEGRDGDDGTESGGANLA